MPTTLQALIILFVFAIPAYIAITVFKTRNPIHYYKEKQSPIEQATLYIFLGTLVNMLTILFVLLLSILVWSLPLARAAPILNISTDTVSGLLTVYLLLIVAFFATSVPFSYLIGDILLVYLFPADPPLWVKEFETLKVRQAKADTEVAWVLVHLKKGDRCLGLINEVRWIGGENNTMELTLEKVYYQLADSKEKEKIGRVLLRSDDILWLSPYSE